MSALAEGEGGGGGAGGPPWHSNKFPHGCPSINKNPGQCSCRLY